jgi:hypothetical protein
MNAKLECLQFVLTNNTILKSAFPNKSILEIATEIYMWQTDPELEKKLHKANSIIEYAHRKSSIAQILTTTTPINE